MDGHPVFQIKVGNGATKVLLWSQMHGNEPTATMAILDLFNFLGQDHRFSEVKEKIFSKTTLYFIPMLNPDGANRFERRNRLGIDINRDALRLQTPEGRILKAACDKLNPEWGFNLHDQGAYYGAGNTPHSASFSFLAPAFDEAKSSSPKRDDAMKLIVSMWQMLQHFIPGYIGRYNDTFEPRAFGDNIQKWGTRTILIETGSYKNDREKQYLRQLHFLILIQAFLEISNQSYVENSVADYEKIPFNRVGSFHDLIIREVERHYRGDTFKIDLSFRNFEIEIPATDSFYLQSTITDIGDLSVYNAYQDFDGSDFVVEIGKKYPHPLNSTILEQLDLPALLRDGVTTFRISDPEQLSDLSNLKLPFTFITSEEEYEDQLLPGTNPDLVLIRNGEIAFFIFNGQLFPINTFFQE